MLNVPVCACVRACACVQWIKSFGELKQRLQTLPVLFDEIAFHNRGR